MLVRELEPDGLNSGSRKFLLNWRRGCFALIVALYVLLLLMVLPFRPVFSAAGFAAALASGLWLGFRSPRQRVETDVACMVICVACLALLMYLETGPHAPPVLSDLAFAAASVAAGISAGRMAVRLAEAELYALSLYGRSACRVQSIVEGICILVFAWFGLRMGRYFLARDASLLYACMLLLFACIAYAVYLKFRTIVPLEHSRN